MIRILGKGRNGQRDARPFSCRRSGRRRQNAAAGSCRQRTVVKKIFARNRSRASLRHPHIVSYIEHGTHNGIVYLVTEFVGGMDASKLSKTRGGRLDYREVVVIIEQTLGALDFAHSQGFVHRDIKEQNILVDGTYPKYVAKLTDFGLAKSFKQTGMSGVTMVGDVAGTIAYMPPEQVRDFKEVKPPSDIYAIGMTAYSLVTGAHALDISPRAGISETVKAIFEKTDCPDKPTSAGSSATRRCRHRNRHRQRTGAAMAQRRTDARSLVGSDGIKFFVFSPSFLLVL
jgi:serine/threonine-protein kinase